MKKITKIILYTLLVVLITTSCKYESSPSENSQSNKIASASNKDIIIGQYIVFFKESKLPSALNQLGKTSFMSREAKANAVEKISKNSVKQINTILKANQVNTSKVLNYYTTSASGMAIKLTDKEFDKLSRDENVASIEFDRKIELQEFEAKNITAIGKAAENSQTIPCGVKMAGGFVDGSKKRNWIWIIDSGIDLDHPDLNVVTDSKFAKSFIKEEPSPNDCSGHGTHVAGIAAAIDNDLGVVGVSAGASVVPVKIMDCSNYSSTSIILSGVNHVGKYGLSGDVVNMSISNKGRIGKECSKTTVFKSPIRSLSRKGMFVILSAGNFNTLAKAYEPCCVNGDNIFTIGGIDCDGRFDNSYSNVNSQYLNPIDFVAVGSNVKSTYLNGGYARLTGTSMSAPHVAGIIHARGRAPKILKFIDDGYGYGQKYPIAVRK